MSRKSDDGSMGSFLAIECVRGRLLGAGWPCVLIDAVLDSNFYVLGMKSGQAFAFDDAEPRGANDAWVSINVGEGLFCLHESHSALLSRGGHEAEFPRRVEIRVSEIAWVTTQPFGQ